MMNDMNVMQFMMIFNDFFVNKYKNEMIEIQEKCNERNIENIEIEHQIFQCCKEYETKQIEHVLLFFSFLFFHSLIIIYIQ